MKNYMQNLFEKIKNNAKKIYYQGRLKVYQNNMRNTRKVMKKIIGKNKSLEIRQKGESQNGCYKKTRHAKFSEKRTFLTP